MKKFLIKALTKKARVAIIMSLIMLVSSVSGLCFALTGLGSSSAEGNIDFIAQDVNATVSQATVSGGTVSGGEDALPEIVFSTEESEEQEDDTVVPEEPDTTEEDTTTNVEQPQEQNPTTPPNLKEKINTLTDAQKAALGIGSWQNVDIEFDDDSTEVSIAFTVTNTGEDDLAIDLKSVSGTFENASYSIKINGKQIDSTANNAEGIITQNISAEIEITFTVIDENGEAKIKNFTVPFEFKTTTEKPEEPEESDFTYEYTASGNGIYFGEWPQTIAAPGITFASTPDNNGYYLGSDGERYAKYTTRYLETVAEMNPDDMPTEEEWEMFYSFEMSKASDGTIMTDGNTYYFKVEPLCWTIVEKDPSSNYATIVCNSIVESLAYQPNIKQDTDEKYYITDKQGNFITDASGNKIYANNYEYSALRKFLIEDFYNRAFTSIQKSLIQQITVNNSASSTGDSSNPYYCNNTTDKVWTFSYAEMNQYVGEPESMAEVLDKLAVKPTDFAKAEGIMNTPKAYWELALGQSIDPALTDAYILMYLFQEDVDVEYVDDVYVYTITQEQKKILEAFYGMGSFLTRSPSSNGSDCVYGTVILGGESQSVNTPFMGVVPALVVNLDPALETPSTTTFTYELTEDGKGIYFGEWPQTLAAPGVTFSCVPDTDGYYRGSDGERYAKYTTKYSSLGDNSEIFVEFGMSTTSNGTALQDDTTYYFKVEPLLWDIAVQEDGIALLVCRTILQAQAYQANYEQSGSYYYATDADGDIITDEEGNKVLANDYEYSQVRQFLIDDFYNSAFNSLQKELLSQVEGYYTDDPVWLLGDEDLDIISSAHPELEADPTFIISRQVSDFAKATATMTASKQYLQFLFSLMGGGELSSDEVDALVLTEFLKISIEPNADGSYTFTSEQRALLDELYNSSVWMTRIPADSYGEEIYGLSFMGGSTSAINNPMSGALPVLVIPLGE